MDTMSTYQPPTPPIISPADLALDGQPVGLLATADGDTIRIRGTCLITLEDRVRLLGIDAPERNEVGWATAREHLASLVRGQELRLEGVHPRTLTRGRCNRILAWVWAGDVLVNWAMCLSGMARSARDWGDGRYTPALEEAAKWAAANGFPHAVYGPGRRPNAK